MRPGDELQEKIYILNHVTLKEGEMWGIDMSMISKWVDSDGILKIKFII